MTSALIVCSNVAEAPPLIADLTAVGIQLVGVVEYAALTETAIKSAPDIVVCYENFPGDAFFLSISALAATAPRPVIVFTNDPDAERIERATQAGIHSYVVNGYGVHRLRSIIHVAQARFRRDELLRGELVDVNNRFDERKLVDRAKGILMRSHQISEDEAFRALRTAAMHSKQRVGQVSQQIIESARYGEAVNRAGQLRMFSQRIVKLYALICADVRIEETRALFKDSQDSIAGNLAILGRTLSKATFGDLLDGVSSPWTQLKPMLKLRASVDRLAEIDALAERLLAQAEQLVLNLEIAGISKSLTIINVAGRQRMLSQRMAKQALLAALLPEAEAIRVAAAQSETAFVETLAYLATVPLVTRETTELLAMATAAWAPLRAALAQAGSADGRDRIAVLSESLLDIFDRLTERYELGMQSLMK